MNTEICAKEAIERSHAEFMNSLQKYFVSLHSQIHACGPNDAAPYLRRTRGVMNQSLKALEENKGIHRANARINNEISRSNKAINKAVARANNAFMQDMSGFENALKQLNNKPKQVNKPRKTVRFANNQLTNVREIPGRRLTRAEQRMFSNLDVNPLTKKRYARHMQKKLRVAMGGK